MKAGLVALAVTALSAPGAAVFMDIQPRSLRIHETATLTLTFEGIENPPTPELADIPGFTAQYAGTQQQFTFVNGQSQRNVSFSYRLIPNTTGTFTIGPFNLTLQGRNYAIDAIEVKVVATGESTETDQQFGDLIFARITTDRERVFLHEQFDIRLSVYYRGIRIDRSINLGNMPATGLHIDPFEEIRSSREVVDNELFEVRHFRARALAVSTGTIAIHPKLQAGIIVERQTSRDPFFGGFDAFFQRHERHPVEVAIEPWTMTVAPLPTDQRPPDFRGAVGQFELDVNVSRRDVKVGDPVSINVRIQGSGNLESLAFPTLPLDERFRTFEPKLTEQRMAQDRRSGVKAFELVVIPRDPAITEIPPLSFSFFDPQSERYQTLTRGPFPLDVIEGDTPAADMISANGISPTFMQTLGRDIIYLKSAPTTGRTPLLDPLASTAARTAQLVPLLALFAVGFWRLRRDRDGRDPSRVRRQQAPKVARAAIQRARESIADPTAFYAHIWEALALYMANRLDLDRGLISPDFILRIADQAQLPAEDRTQLETTLRQSEEVRFGGNPGGTPEERTAQLNGVTRFMRVCEKARRLTQ